MKRKQYGTLFAAALLAVAWATPIFAQERLRARDGILDRDNALNFILRPSDRLLERALDNLDSLPEDLQQDIADLQDSMLVLTSAWINDYRPGADATLGEIEAAREAFVTDYVDEIAENRSLRKEVVTELRNGIRERFGNQEWNEEARGLYQQYNEIKMQLAMQWRRVRASLPDDSTREDIREARRRFLEANADVIAQQKEIAQQIRDLIKDNRGDRPVAKRQPLPPELQAMRDEIHLARAELRARKQELRAELSDLTPEEREARRLEILDELKEAHDDIKARRRQLIDDLRGEQDGDRRPED